MAAGSSTARAPVLETGATPVHRLGEQVFDVIAEIGDVATFSVLTLVVDRPPACALVGARSDLLRHRGQERLGGRDHGNVHRNGPGGSGLSSVRHDGAGDPAGLGDQHLDRERARPGAGGDNARGPGRFLDGRRAGDDAGHRADRRLVGTRDEPHLLPGRSAISGLRFADSPSDADGRFHGGDRRSGGQHADLQDRLVRLLEAHARLPGQPRHLRRRSSRATSSARPLRSSVAIAGFTPAPGQRASAGPRPRHSSIRSSRSCSSTSCSGSAGTTCTGRYGPSRKVYYEPPRSGRRSGEPRA